MLEESTWHKLVKIMYKIYLFMLSFMLYIIFRKKVSEEEGFTRHYRHCRNDTKKHSYMACMYTDTRVTDNSVALWARHIQDNVRRVRRDILDNR